ncbi:MSMEG_0570 family nitrogen starvation response protein [Williamsia sterculiae]|uniref:MSMEG_0570 family protein n=1 Tax=Williamsia sterculiae TaxID=1344003 RepID=A0A1N7ELA9_9NOCA|nr:MSMEG_0570 family nitrogen starvation response protein [Williamsia sterculiae]SIR88857.1 MSMEG_0570 family protein [Williamsia sterculiae]
MPEMTFAVRWPDGEISDCYSPSLVIHDHIRTGITYSVADFVERTGDALTEAGERVRARYGFACTSAAATADHIRSRADRFDDDALVHVVAMRPL